MSALWSAEQQAWLKALGHRVMVLAGDDPVFDAVAEEVSAAARAPGANESRSSDTVPARPREMSARGTAADIVATREMPTGARNVAGGEAPTRHTPPSKPQSAAAASRPTAPGDALERALLRATGQRTRSEARAVLEGLGVDAAALRGDAVGKRALWRRLRPLRPRFRP